MAKFLKANAAFVQEGYMQGLLYDVGTYPAATYEDGALTHIHGNIFRLRDRTKVFSVLDSYEGVEEELYLRCIRPIYINEEQTLQCWVYLYNYSTYHLKLIPHGNYLKYLSE